MTALNNSNELIIAEVRPLLERLAAVNPYYVQWSQHPWADPQFHDGMPPLPEDGVSGIWAQARDLQNIRFDRLRALAGISLDAHAPAVFAEGYPKPPLRAESPEFNEAMTALKKATRDLDTWVVWHGEVSDAAWYRCGDLKCAGEEYRDEIDKFTEAVRRAHDVVHGEFLAAQDQIRSLELQQPWLPKDDDWAKGLGAIEFAREHGQSRESALQNRQNGATNMEIFLNENVIFLQDAIKLNDELCRLYESVLDPLTHILDRLHRVTADAWNALGEVCDCLDLPNMHRLKIPGLSPRKEDTFDSAEYWSRQDKRIPEPLHLAPLHQLNGIGSTERRENNPANLEFLTARLKDPEHTNPEVRNTVTVDAQFERPQPRSPHQPQPSLELYPADAATQPIPDPTRALEESETHSNDRGAHVEISNVPPGEYVAVYTPEQGEPVRSEPLQLGMTPPKEQPR